MRKAITIVENAPIEDKPYMMKAVKEKDAVDLYITGLQGRFVLKMGHRKRLAKFLLEGVPNVTVKEVEKK